MTDEQDLERVLVEKYRGASSARTRGWRLFRLHGKHFLFALGLKIGGVIKRILDIVLSLSGILFLGPLMLWIALRRRALFGNSLQRTPILDASGRAKMLYQFRTSVDSAQRPGLLDRLPQLFNILRGDLSFVGPVPVAESAGGLEPTYVQRGMRPGLTNFFFLRSAANIAHEGMEAADREYIFRSSLKTDVGIMARSLIMMVMAGDKGSPPAHIDMLDIRIDNLTMSDAVDWIVEQARGTTPAQLAFVNPDCMNIACRDGVYKSLLQRLDLVLADGIGIHLGCRILKTSMADNVNGTDLFPYLCSAAEQRGLPVYFLGGRPGVAGGMVERLRERYPKLQIAGYADGYFSDEEESAVIERIHGSGARILLVAFGAPRQELWIDANLSRLGVGVAMGVGGLFDFMSGRVQRAPLWMREIGMEWAYRLLQEPGRMWRRYIIGNPLYLWRIWRWKKAAS